MSGDCALSDFSFIFIDGIPHENVVARGESPGWLPFIPARQV